MRINTKDHFRATGKIRRRMVGLERAYLQVVEDVLREGGTEVVRSAYYPKAEKLRRRFLGYYRNHGGRYSSGGAPEWGLHFWTWSDVGRYRWEPLF
jgi:hypothetical protein